ncbi:MAG: Histone deacetylase-like amidohydrolase [Candidatus Dichloromethanomonas elyunquensis]|nr:MAG: Histone deacetylase-like amidohydrolase [Candidatus Dichloromethanomonas elyunquensis]
MNKTGIIFFPAFDWSLGESHPEREERLLYTQEQIFEEGIMDLPQIKQYSPGVADLMDVLRTQAIFPRLEKLHLDAHLIAAGSSIILGKAIMDKEIHNGFALVRPPGHHSGATVWGNRGFCTLNNEAILVNYLRAHYGIKKVAIIDTDVHHGDGTQDIFYYDPNVLCVSIHQDGRTLFPGTGFTDEKGGPNSWGSTLNIPLIPGVGDEGFLYALENWVLPRVEEFKPDIIINSAGQDNHYTDPLASMNVSARGYGKITEFIKPDLAVLEGGYSIQGALPYVNLAILLALAGEDYSGVIEPQKLQRREIGGETFRSYLLNLKRQNENIRPNWTLKKESCFPAGEWVCIEKNIFYDTDWFQEYRKDYIRKCNHCGGTVLTLSRNELTFEKAVLVRIPFEACEACVQTGYDLVEHFKNTEKTLLLQDQLQNKIMLWHDGREVSFDEQKNQTA